MRNPLRLLSPAIWILLLAPGWPPPLWADVTLHQRVTFRFLDARSRPPLKVIFYAKGRRARFEGDGWRKKPTIVRFDKGLILRLDPKRKAYTKIPIKDLEDILKGVTKIVKGVDEFLAGGKSTRRKKAYRLVPTAETDKVHGLDARVYLLRQGKKDKVRAKIWITPESDAGKEIYILQRDIAKISAHLLAPMDRMLFDELERIGGTAVRILLLGKTGAFGPVRTDWVVEKIDRRELDESLFEVPEGYREEKDPDEQTAGGRTRKPSAVERQMKTLQKLFR